MGFRFRKSFGKGPFRVTVSKSGVGYSVGGKGFRYTKKAGGGTRTTASIPGTGISFVSDSGSKAKNSRPVSSKPVPSTTSPVKPIVSNPDTISTTPTSSSVINRHKYCPKCRKEIPLDATKCPHCGKRWSGGDFDINPIWGIATLILGLALIGSAPLLALIFLIATICLAVKGIKVKKAKPSVPATSSSSVPLPEQPHAPALQNVVTIAPDSTTQDSPQEICPLAVPAVTPISEPAAAPFVAKTYKVTGMQHYMDNIDSMANENPDYDMSKRDIIDCGMTDERIWKYTFHPEKIELVPEPDNPYDPKAIKVVVDGQQVGYIKSGSCAHLLKIISEERIRGIDCEMGGGPYKKVTEEYDYDTEKDVYTFERDTVPHFVHLTVYEATK